VFEVGVQRSASEVTLPSEVGLALGAAFKASFPEVPTQRCAAFTDLVRVSVSTSCTEARF